MKTVFHSRGLRRTIPSMSDSALEAKVTHYEQMTWTTFGRVSASIMVMYATGLLVAA